MLKAENVQRINKTTTFNLIYICYFPNTQISFIIIERIRHTNTFRAVAMYCTGNNVTTKVTKLLSLNTGLEVFVTSTAGSCERNISLVYYILIYIVNF